MHKLLLRLILTGSFLLFISGNIKADTLDYWHVYINDSLTLKLNITSQNLDFKFNPKKVQVKDSLSVFYMNDAPCANCEYMYIIKDERGNKLLTERATDLNIKVSFSMTDIRHEMELRKSSKLRLFIYENNFDGEKDFYMALLNIVSGEPVKSATN